MKLPLGSIRPYQAMGERRSNPTHLAPSLFFSTPTSHKGDGKGLRTYRRISHERHTIRKASFEGKSWEIQYRLIDILIMNQDGQFHLRVEWDHLFWIGNDQTLTKALESGCRCLIRNLPLSGCVIIWVVPSHESTWLHVGKIAARAFGTTVISHMSQFLGNTKTSC